MMIRSVCVSCKKEFIAYHHPHGRCSCGGAFDSEVTRRKPSTPFPHGYCVFNVDGEPLITTFSCDLYVTLRKGLEAVVMPIMPWGWSAYALSVDECINLWKDTARRQGFSVRYANLKIMGAVSELE